MRINASSKRWTIEVLSTLLFLMFLAGILVGIVTTDDRLVNSATSQSVSATA